MVAALQAGCTTKSLEGPLTPTPASITRDNPGGDARDPLYAALLRLRDERWGKKNDRHRTLDVPLPDAGRWLRVRFWGYPTRAGFRYGKDHYAVVVVSYTDAEPGQDTPAACRDSFVDKALHVAKSFDMVVGDLVHANIDRPGLRTRKGLVLPSVFENSQVPVVRTDGHFATFTNDENYFAAIAAYPSWPGTCLVQAFAVETGDHEELAREVVDRWVREGAPKLFFRRALTEAPPREDR